MSIGNAWNSCKLCKLDIGVTAGRWTDREPIEHWHYGCAQAAGLTTKITPFITISEPPTSMGAGQRSMAMLPKEAGWLAEHGDWLSPEIYR